MKKHSPPFKACKVAALRFLNRLESHQQDSVKRVEFPSSSDSETLSATKEEDKLLLSPFWEKVIMLILLAGIVAIHDEIWCETLEELVDKAHSFVNNKVKTFGLSAATIIGCIFALARGSLKMAGIIVLTGIVIAFFFKWVEGGLKLPA